MKRKELEKSYFVIGLQQMVVLVNVEVGIRVVVAGGGDGVVVVVDV